MAKSMAFWGLQNGDEGKGKVVDYVAAMLEEKLEEGERIASIRYQGGANAGHSVETDDFSLALHQVGSSITNPKVFALQGTGMYFNPRLAMGEIQGLQKQGVKVSPDNLGISSRAQITLDHHVGEDQSSYNLAEHTSTGKGIKQTARDKFFRTNMRFVEFLDNDLMAEILTTKVFPDFFPTPLGSIEQYVNSYEEVRDFLGPFLVEPTALLNDPSFAFHLYEGAQGFLLDIDDGQYPGITSSNPCRPPVQVDLSVGLFKCYVSSVGIGERPFISEMPQDIQDAVWEQWKEYGTTTGKRRHIGWMDALALKYAVQTTQPTFVAATCLDRLEDLSKISHQGHIVTAYEVDGKIYDTWNAMFDRRDTLSKATPIVETFQTWSETTNKSGSTLTTKAMDYVHRIEDLIGRQVDLVGVGPKRQDTIERVNLQKYFG